MQAATQNAMQDNFRMKILTQTNIQASASGKAILVGEHSVVYGYKAIAMALPDIKLTITLFANHNLKYSEQVKNLSWIKLFSTVIQDKQVEVEERINKLLLTAFQKALFLVGFTNSLQEFSPQKILIHSHIPLGGGMGGSAAISTCFIRIAAQIVNKQLTFVDEINYANEIDSLFHNGKASGLDVSAVASNGIIEFQKQTQPRKINNKCSFWIALVDSGERSETACMIEKVKNYYDKKPILIERLFLQLNRYALDCSLFLEQGKLKEFADCLNQTHICLDNLGISTPKMNNIVEFLKKHGALGAKLTGAGGGGLVLGVFETEPAFLLEHFDKNCVYISQV